MEKYVAVVGSVNIDIWGRAASALIARDSNPGEIRYSPGGVGRNIAHNLSLLGERVQMLTAIGGDAWAQTVEQSCRECGIGLDHALRLPDKRCSAYMYMTGPEGEMALALCDAEIVDAIDPAAIERALDFLDRARLVVFDGNLREDTIDCLTARCSAPLFTDPTSVTKARKIKPYLSRIHTVKPNLLEAQELTGIADAMGAAAELVYMGVKRAFVSDSARGMAAAHGLDCYHVDCCRSAMVNSTGAGDAVMAAVCKSFLDGRDIVSSAHYAMAAGAIACECNSTINPAMSDENVRSRMST